MLLMATSKGKAEYTTKIPGSTVFEVRDRYETVFKRQILRDDKVEFFDVQVTREAMTNAIVLHFLDLSQDQQDSIIRRYVKVFEGLTSLEARVKVADVVATPERASKSKSKSPGKRKKEGS